MNLLKKIGDGIQDGIDLATGKAKRDFIKNEQRKARESEERLTQLGIQGANRAQQLQLEAAEEIQRIAVQRAKVLMAGVVFIVVIAIIGFVILPKLKIGNE